MPKDRYMCQLCANHGIFDQLKRGHKQYCGFRTCNCRLCSLNAQRRALDQSERQLKNDESPESPDITISKVVVSHPPTLSGPHRSYPSVSAAMSRRVLSTASPARHPVFLPMLTAGSPVAVPSFSHRRPISGSSVELHAYTSSQTTQPLAPTIRLSFEQTNGPDVTPVPMLTSTAHVVGGRYSPLASLSSLASTNGLLVTTAGQIDDCATVAEAGCRETGNTVAVGPSLRERMVTDSGHAGHSSTDSDQQDPLHLLTGAEDVVSAPVDCLIVQPDSGSPNGGKKPSIFTSVEQLARSSC